MPHGTEIHGIAAGNGRIVAVGNARSIVTSTNPGSWAQVRGYDKFTHLRGAAYGNGKFVAVGSGVTNSLILHSADGLNWSGAQLAGVSGGFNFVVFANGQFLTIEGSYPGSYGSVLTSSDGESWTEIGSSIGGGYGKLWFLNGQYVQLGGDTLKYSTDGRSWRYPYNEPPELTIAVAYGNGVYVGVGYNEYQSEYAPRIFTSLDLSAWGHRWSRYEPNSFGRFTTVAYGNGRFVVLGTFSDWATDTDHNLHFTSADGITWTEHPPLPYLSRPRELVFTGQQFVAVGDFGNISTSTDGITWTHHSRGTQNNFRGVAYGSGRFVAVGNNGTNLTSADGITWTPTESGTRKNLRGVEFADGRFIAVGSDGTILSSASGVDWTKQTSGTDENLFDLAYGAGTWVAVGGDFRNSPTPWGWRGSVLSSSNGVDWVARISASWSTDFTQMHGIVYGNGWFVVVGDRSTILRSSDGLTWTTNRIRPFVDYDGDYIKSIAYGNGRFVAVGENVPILVSTDGILWHSRDLPDGADPDLDEVEFADGRFIAVGDGGVIASSRDGDTWIIERSPTDTRLRGIAYGAGSWVAVGNNDTILQSAPSGGRLSLASHAPAGTVLEFTGETEVTYDVQAAESVPTESWRSIASVTLKTLSTNVLDTTPGANSQRFYRLRSP